MSSILNGCPTLLAKAETTTTTDLEKEDWRVQELKFDYINPNENTTASKFMDNNNNNNNNNNNKEISQKYI